MLGVPVNLASNPFFTNRKFYALSLISGGLLLVLSTANLYFYLAYRDKSLRLNQALAHQVTEIQQLEQSQEQIWKRLQQPETEDFLELVDYLNPLITQRTFSWTRFLNHLEKLIPYNLQIVTITPKAVEGEIVVKIICNAQSGASYIDFISRLESSPDFYGVNLMTEDISKSRNFFGKQYGMLVKYRAQGSQN